MGVFSLEDFETLKSEKFLNFSQKNKKVYYDPKEQIKCSIFVKNIEEITVNFFDIDVLRYHQTSPLQTEFNNQISVDGIIP